MCGLHCTCRSPRSSAAGGVTIIYMALCGDTCGTSCSAFTVSIPVVAPRARGPESCSTRLKLRGTIYNGCATSRGNILTGQHQSTPRLVHSRCSIHVAMLPREERHDSCSEPGAHGLCEDLSPLDPHPSFCEGALAWALSLEL